MIKFTYKIILFILLNTILISFVQAQKGGYSKIKNYSKSDYESGTQNWDIDQDKNGNIYFANNNGLLQFDGEQWQKYKIQNSANIRSIAIHEETGRIYVGGYNEFGYFESDETGALIYTSLVSKIEIEDYKIFDYLWKIHIVGDEVIFQSFKSAFILKDNNIRILNPPNRFQFSFHVGNKVYFQDIISGLYEYDDGKLTAIPGTEVFNNSEIWGITALPENKLLISTLENGLYILKNKTISPWESEANEFVSKNSSLGACLTSNNHLIFNSVLEGAVVCNLNGEILQRINLKSGLQNNTILTTFIDHKENLWLGLDNGISFVNINSPFTYFSSGLNFSTVYSSIIHNDLLYVATNQGVFYNELSAAYENEPFQKVAGTAVQTWNIQLIEDELICANNNGAFIIKNGEVSKVLDKKGYFGFIEIPNNTKYVIGSEYRGLTIFEKTSDGLAFRNRLKGFDNSSNLFEIDQSSLWVLKNQNLYQLKLNKNLDSVLIINAVTELPGNLPIDMIFKMNGRIRFKSKNIFFNYSKELGDFIPDPLLNRLFSEIPSVYILKEDMFGNIWYTSGQYLGQFFLNKNGEYERNPQPFSNMTGNLVVNYLSVNTLDKSNAFIGLIDGLVHYDLSVPLNNLEKPKLFIRSFVYDNQTTTYGNPQDKSWKHVIPYSANNVTFTFSSPEFDNTKNVTYTYQLEPFDDEWSPETSNIFKEYTNLSEGKYNMKVKVKNSYEMESDIVELQFTISPPWYRHILAYLLYILIFLFAIFITSKQIKAKIRKNKYNELIEQRKLYLEKESKIKIEQYQLEKEIEKLNRDKLQTSILAKDKELVNNSLQVVKKNKILNGIIKKLKEMDVTAMDDKTKSQINRLKNGIVKEVNNDESWKDLEKHIKNVHFDFLKRLKEKYPSISPRELDLSTYLLINMSTKEIAEVMNITTGGVELARYRLRKKLALERKQNLTGFLMEI